MTIEIRVPTLGESVKEATVGKWFKQPGEAVAADEPLVELETDKVTVEVPAPVAGVLGELQVQKGATVEVGAVLASIAEGATPTVASKPAVSKPAAPAKEQAKPAAPSAKPAAAPRPAPAASTGQPSGAAPAQAPAAAKAAAAPSASQGPVTLPPPSARKLDPAKGADGAAPRRATVNGDVIAAIASGIAAAPAASAQHARAPSPVADAEREERVAMTRLRQTIARRLKDAQNTAAMLTTFNDVDMGGVMQLRSQYKEAFEKKHGVKLGFMGFFVKACVAALKEIPAVNAEIDGTDVVYKNYYHIGVAVGTDRGLVVPVLREADGLTLAQVEASIADFGKRARDGKLTIEEMQGGTFTISNGGVYGSLLSTPILNAPQAGILGMHRIEERPVVRAGAIVARPMMYLALSYDHRLVDGREAVTFLVRVKEALEDPQRLMLEV